MKKLTWRKYNDQDKNCPTLSTRYEFVWRLGQHTDSQKATRMAWLYGGGGQDSGQTIIKNDLLKRADELKQLATSGVPMLMICGMYQLFGRFFRTLKGEEIIGANILPIETIAGNERMIGNIVIKSHEFGEIVGYENHSGQTFLDKETTPLGNVIKGAGNNMSDPYEGVRYHNIIATYLHGPNC